jgi:hypothetical protein
MFQISGITVGGDEPTLPWVSYLTVASSLMPGMQALDANDGNTHAAHALLCCHALECVLKAYLSHTPTADLLQRPDIRHNLNRLWQLSAETGLSIQADPPVWVQQLDFLHDKPYYLRYAKGVVGVAMPPPEPARSELARLLSVVEALVM